jgi:hypothetical protein
MLLLHGVDPQGMHHTSQLHLAIIAQGGVLRLIRRLI